jgi:hypothetical protein
MDLALDFRCGSSRSTQMLTRWLEAVHGVDIALRREILGAAADDWARPHHLSCQFTVRLP